MAPVSAAETRDASPGPAASKMVTRIAEAERAADVVGDVDHPAGRTGVARGDARHPGAGQRAEAEALPDAEDDHRQADVAAAAAKAAGVTGRNATPAPSGL